MDFDFLKPYGIPYLIIINSFTFLAFLIDKIKAVRGRWRIREGTLMMLCVLGGSFGAYLSMKIFHHKVKKDRFQVGVPILLGLNILLFYLLIRGVWLST